MPIAVRFEPPPDQPACGCIWQTGRLVCGNFNLAPQRFYPEFSRLRIRELMGFMNFSG